MSTALNFFRKKVEAYLDMRIRKAPYEFTNNGDISDGRRAFAGAPLSSNAYARWVRDISISPSRAKQMEEPLTEADPFKLRPEFGGVNSDFSY